MENYEKHTSSIGAAFGRAPQGRGPPLGVCLRCVFHNFPKVFVCFSFVFIDFYMFSIGFYRFLISTCHHFFIWGVEGRKINDFKKAEPLKSYDSRVFLKVFHFFMKFKISCLAPSGLPFWVHFGSFWRLWDVLGAILGPLWKHLD